MNKEDFISELKTIMPENPKFIEKISKEIDGMLSFNMDDETIFDILQRQVYQVGQEPNFIDKHLNFTRPLNALKSDEPFTSLDAVMAHHFLSSKVQDVDALNKMIVNFNNMNGIINTAISQFVMGNRHRHNNGRRRLVDYAIKHLKATTDEVTNKDIALYRLVNIIEYQKHLNAMQNMGDIFSERNIPLINDYAGIMSEIFVGIMDKDPTSYEQGVAERFIKQAATATRVDVINDNSQPSIESLSLLIAIMDTFKVSVFDDSVREAIYAAESETVLPFIENYAFNRDNNQINYRSEQKDENPELPRNFSI